MKVKEIKGLECPHCQEFVTAEDIGLEIERAIETRYQCGKCDQVYEDKAEARDCCKE